MGVAEIFFAYWDWYLLAGVFVTCWFFMMIPDGADAKYGFWVHALAGAVVLLMWPAVIVYRYSK